MIFADNYDFGLFDLFFVVICSREIKENVQYAFSQSWLVSVFFLRLKGSSFLAT